MLSDLSESVSAWGLLWAQTYPGPNQPEGVQLFVTFSFKWVAESGVPEVLLESLEVRRAILSLRKVLQ